MIVAQIYFGATDFLHNTKLSRRNILFVQYFNNSKCLSYLLRTNFNLEWFWSVVDYSLQKLVCTHKIFMRINSMFQVSEEERRKFEAEFNQYYKDLERAKEEWVFIISVVLLTCQSTFLPVYFPSLFFLCFFSVSCSSIVPHPAPCCVSIPHHLYFLLALHVHILINFLSLDYLFLCVFIDVSLT